MVEFWKKLALFLGWGVPPGDQEPVVNGAPPYWALEFDSDLPGMQGRVAVPVGPGRNLMIPFKAITVSEAFGVFGQMLELRDQWPFGPEIDAFAGYLVLEGPGWDLTVFFTKPSPRVEYHAGKLNGGVRVSGEVVWPVLAQALVLSPDFDAVVGYLMLNPYRAPYVV